MVPPFLFLAFEIFVKQLHSLLLIVYIRVVGIVLSLIVRSDRLNISRIILLIHSLTITELQSILFVRSDLEMIDVPLHFFVYSLVVLIAIVKTFEFLLRVLVEVSFPFIFFHIFLLSRKSFLFVLLAQILAHV